MEVEEEEDCGSGQDNFRFPDNSTSVNAETIRQDPAPSTSRVMVALSSRAFRANKMANRRMVKKKIPRFCPRVKQMMAMETAPLLIPPGGAEEAEVASSVNQQASGSGETVRLKTPLVFFSNCPMSAEKSAFHDSYAARRGVGKAKDKGKSSLMSDADFKSWWQAFLNEPPEILKDTVTVSDETIAKLQKIHL